MLCELEEIPDKPGFQRCRTCLRPRGWPGKQTRPKDIPRNYVRKCPGQWVDVQEETKATAVERVKSAFKKGAGAMSRMAKKAASYTAAELRWIAWGRPTRSPETIAANHAICMACEHYRPGKKKPEKGSCKLCGCRINLSSNGLVNKHAAATEWCPAGKWTFDLTPLVLSGPFQFRGPDPDDGRSG